MSQQATLDETGGQRFCAQCGATFESRRPNKRFCSTVCNKRWWNQNREPQRPNAFFNCKTCGKHVERYVESNKLASGLATAEYCSRKCKGGALSGDKHPMWKGGRLVEEDGYVVVFMPGHPHANNKGYVFEHRLVMEATLGRYLEVVEVVHHENGNPSDNRLDNLRLYESNAEHKRDDIVHRKRNAQGRLLPKEV